MHKINFALILSGLVARVVLPLAAQGLAPRAYIITPLHSNAVTLTWGFYSGGLNFNGAIPITGATGTYAFRKKSSATPTSAASAFQCRGCGTHFPAWIAEE
jgi:hypothetical protein